jgi:hypothetical protein
VICSGSNDYELNELSSTFQNHTNFIQTNNHTNIIPINVPFRYDLPNSTSVNSSISILNRKLKKLVKVFSQISFLETDNNRNLFTSHGLHFNKSGKQPDTYQISSPLHLTFKQKTSDPIILGWYNEIKDNNNFICEVNQVKFPTGIPVVTKKIPITTSNDFLW